MISDIGVKFAKDKLDELNNKLDITKKQLSNASEQGDLSENAEYDSAMSDLDKLNLNIKNIKELLQVSKVVNLSDISTEEVVFGSRVEVSTDKNKLIIYNILSSYEACDDNIINLIDGVIISLSSLIGKSLLNHKVGDVVNIELPNNSIEYTINKIEKIKLKESN